MTILCGFDEMLKSVERIIGVIKPIHRYEQKIKE